MPILKSCLTLLGIKPKSAALEACALTTRPSVQLAICESIDIAMFELRFLGSFFSARNFLIQNLFLQATLSQYFSSRHCLCCKSLSTNALCAQCMRNPLSRQQCAVKLTSELSRIDKRSARINQVRISISC